MNLRHIKNRLNDTETKTAIKDFGGVLLPEKKFIPVVHAPTQRGQASYSDTSDNGLGIRILVVDSAEKYGSLFNVYKFPSLNKAKGCIARMCKWGQTETKGTEQ